MGGYLPGGGHTAGAKRAFILSKTQLDTPHRETEQEGTVLVIYIILNGKLVAFIEIKIKLKI